MMARRSSFPTPRSLSGEGLRRFSRTRTARIRSALGEIGYAYGEVDFYITQKVDDLLDQVAELETSIDGAAAEGRGAL